MPENPEHEMTPRQITRRLTVYMSSATCSCGWTAEAEAETLGLALTEAAKLHKLHVQSENILQGKQAKKR